MRKSENKATDGKELFFVCSHCGQKVNCQNLIGTKNRNHCPSCLWSRHVDAETSGDRASLCHDDMAPIALTFKHAGFDKYGHKKQGEIMLVHQCRHCDKVRINRLAGDDDPERILDLLKTSRNLNAKAKKKFAEQEIKLLDEGDREEIKKQLLGKD